VVVEGARSTPKKGSMVDLDDDDSDDYGRRNRTSPKDAREQRRHAKGSSIGSKVEEMVKYKEKLMEKNIRNKAPHCQEEDPR
jgi:hypothetical protein